MSKMAYKGAYLLYIAKSVQFYMPIYGETAIYVGLFVFGFYIFSNSGGKNRAVFFKLIFGEKSVFLRNHSLLRVFSG